VLLVTLLLLWPIRELFLPGRVLIPLDLVTQLWPPWQQPDSAGVVNNGLISDVVTYILPARLFAFGAACGGEWPLWNPLVLGGYPFTYNTQAGLWYPPAWLYCLMDPGIATNLLIIGQMVAGVLFMALWLRSLGLRPPAIAGGALLFMGNGMMLVWLEWQVVHAAVIWLPLQWLLIDRLMARLTDRERASPKAIRRAVGWLAVALALPWLNGHWNWTLYAGMTSGLYLVMQATRSWQTLPRRGSLLIAAAPLLAAGLAMVQILPAFVYLAQSHRGAFTWEEAQARGLWHHLIVLLVPRFFGSPLTGAWRGTEALNFNEATAYAGVGPLVLLLTGLVVWWRGGIDFGRNRHIACFFLIWGAIGFLWMAGSPLYRLLHWLPVFNGLFPARAAVVWLVALPVLTALLVDRFSADSPPSPRHAWWPALLLPALAGGWLLWHRELFGIWQESVYASQGSYPLLLPAGLFWLAAWGVWLARLTGKLGGGGWGWLFVALLAADLLHFGEGYNTIGRRADLYPPTATSRFLQAETEPFRILSLAQGEAYPPNSAMPHGIATLSGYEPGILRSVVAYLTLAEGESPIRFDRKLLPLAAEHSPLLDALNVRYVVTIGDRFGGEARPLHAPPAVADHAPAPLRGMIAVPDGGLQRIELPLRAVRGPVRLAVWSADFGHEFAHAVVTPEAVEGGKGVFAFAPFPAEWGTQFGVEVTGDAEIGRTPDGRPAFTPWQLARPWLVLEDGKSRIYERPAAFPRAWLVYEAVPAADDAGGLALLAQEQAHLDRRVILHQTAPLPPTGPPDPHRRVEYLPQGNNRVTLRVQSTTPAWLVMGDTWYPGWRATLNGQPVPVERANLMMRAIRIPGSADSQTVTLRFLPTDWLAGVTISALSLLATAMLINGKFFSRKFRAAID
jgi:hypothetical protein